MKFTYLAVAMVGDEVWTRHGVKEYNTPQEVSAFRDGVYVGGDGECMYVISSQDVEDAESNKTDEELDRANENALLLRENGGRTLTRVKKCFEEYRRTR